MKATEKQVEAEIEICVAHIARLCGMFQEDVWMTMYEMSKKKINGAKDICTIRSSSAA